MTTPFPGKFARRALLVAPIIVVLGGFLAVLFWLKPRNSTFVLLLSAACSIFVMAYAGFLARRVGRRMDEVQIAGMGYASIHGWVGGMGATVLLLMVPPVTNRLIDLTDVMTAGAMDPTIRHRTAVLLGLYFGFTLLVLMQAACNVVASRIWNRRMGTESQHS